MHPSHYLGSLFPANEVLPQSLILYVWHSFLMGLDKIWQAPSVPIFINVTFCQLGKTLVLGLGPEGPLGFITSAGQRASQLSLKRR